MPSASPLDAPVAPPLRAVGDSDVGAVPRLGFEEIYEEHFAFVWRSLRRLGIEPGSIDDAAQDVFVVVHRRLAEFEGRSSIRSWLFGILLRVARDHRRAARRKRSHILPAVEGETERVNDAASPSPLESLERAEALELLHAVLETLDEDKRVVVILADLEQMSVADIASALGANVNTIYSRLRTARADVERSLARHAARQGWRSR